MRGAVCNSWSATPYAAVRSTATIHCSPSMASSTSAQVGLIPGVSSDQYVATLARWFGVAEAILPTIAPSLNAFSVRDLGFMV